MPQTRLPLAISRHLLRGLFKTVAETQVMADCVFPPIWSCEEKWEVLSRKTEIIRNNEKQIFHNFEFVSELEKLCHDDKKNTAYTYSILKFCFFGGEGASLVHEEALTPK